MPHTFLRTMYSNTSSPNHTLRSLNFFPLLWLACSLVYNALAHAETINNVSDVEIHIENDASQALPKGFSNKEVENKSFINHDADIPNPNLEGTNEAFSEHEMRYDLWQRIKNGYAIPDSTSPLVAKHENWYSTRPDYIKRMVERSQRYLFHIVEEVEKRGMPTEIALLPMIESAYNPQAYSTSRASGIWQFIPSTGKHFGLKQNWWFDNRRNITFATDAALTYLQKLHGMFGSWDLALAAYNAGEGTISRAIERNRKAGLSTDYESLNIPPETKNYVPKLQAVKNLMTNPQNYGLNIQTIANTPYFAKVSAPKQIDAKLAAKLAEITDDEFLALNPSYKRPVITSHDGQAHDLLLPITAAPTFKINLANYNKPLVSWQTYFAKRGERMEKIATRFGIPVAQLRDVNNLPAQNKIKNAGAILVPNGKRADFDPVTDATAQSTDNNDPMTSPQETDYIDTEATSTQEIETESSEKPTQYALMHTVKKGEGLQSIATRYHISVKQLIAANGLKSNRVKVGQLLHIKAKQHNSAPTHASRHQTQQIYVVKRGDTLHSIANQFNVNVTDIKKWNKKTNSHIQLGQKLKIAAQ